MEKLYSVNSYLGLRKLVHHLATNFYIFTILFNLQANVNDVDRFFFLSGKRLKKFNTLCLRLLELNSIAHLCFKILKQVML